MAGSYPATILLALLGAFVLAKRLLRKNVILPPGPPRYPIIGSALSLPKEYQWLKFADWQKTYGDMVYVEALGRPILVLNKRIDATALLDKKSDIYSDRPRLVMMGELCGSALTYAMAPLGEWYIRQKRIMAKALTPAATARYYPLQKDTARRFTLEILEAKDLTTGNLHSYIDLAIARIIFHVLYGHEVKTPDDEFLRLYLRLLQGFANISGQTWIVDIFPILKHIPKWIPGFSFHEVATGHMKGMQAASWGPYHSFREKYSTGDVTPSVCETILRDADGHLTKEDEESMVLGVHSLIGGGLDTSIAAIHTFFLLMLRHPDVQRKAQQEIDHVVGMDRLPTLEDRVNLPYVRSVITEVLRWAPPLPLLLPHATTQDDIYKGYVFDKGTLVFCNIWQMLHDPEDYPSPEKFDPDRYKGDDAVMQPVLTLIFGYGKRVCPGRKMAENTLFSFMANILCMCQILPSYEKDGSAIIPEAKFTGGMLPQPQHFSCDVKPRKSLSILS